MDSLMRIYSSTRSTQLDKHVNNRWALLVRRANLTYGIFLVLEVGILKPRSFKNVHEQCPSHPKAATILDPVQHRVKLEVVIIELDVAGLSVLIQIGRSAKH
jgi:hypothetical protein